HDYLLLTLLVPFQVLLLCFLSDCHCWDVVYFFFFNDPATTEIYTLSLHDALPIFAEATGAPDFVLPFVPAEGRMPVSSGTSGSLDRKSTRLNSSHVAISYAVFCLKKKKTTCSAFVRSLSMGCTE